MSQTTQPQPDPPDAPTPADGDPRAFAAWSDDGARALLESEERLTYALDAVRDGVWDWDVEHDRVYYSPRWCGMLGYAPHEVEPMARAWPPLVHPDDFPRVRAALFAHLKGDTPSYESEYRMRHREGRWLWVLARGRVVERAADGRALRFVGTHVDVTARKQEETVLRAVARASADPGTDTFLEELVRHLATGLGVRFAFIGELVDEPPLQVRTLALWANGAPQPPMTYPLEGTPCALSITTRDGFHVERDVAPRFPADVMLTEMGAQSYHGISLHDAAGVPRGLLAILDDRPLALTPALESVVRTCAARAEGELARRRAAAELAARERQLARAQQIAGVGSWTWSPVTGATTWSAQQYRLLGYEPDEVPAAYPLFRARVHPDDIGALERKIFDSMARGETQWRHEFRLRLPDGTVRWLVGRGEIAYDGAGRAVSVTGTDHDVTERRLLEEQLRHAQKMDAVGRLAGGVAHDFNNLLTVIAGTLDLMRGDLGPAHPAREDLDQVADAADRARALVRQLLAFSRKQVLQLRPLDLNERVRESERLLRRAIGEEVTLRLALCDGPLVVRADAAQVEQVLLNLALNARDAMLHGASPVRELALRTSRAGRAARLVVADSGPGIPADHLPRVFEPFFTTKPLGEGSGLGLSMCYGIVSQLDGTIAVDSVEGEGTTFTIELPLTDEPAHAARPGGVRPAPEGREVVLLVEDEPTVRATMRRMLERLGYTVREAADGTEVVARWPALRGEVHAVLTDVRMPRMGGRELARTLRADAPTLPIVFMSGYTDESHGAPEPNTLFVEKPVPLQRLGEALRTVLRG